MFGLPGLMLDPAGGFEFPPRIAPARARCFAEDGPGAGPPAGLECSAVGEEAGRDEPGDRDWKAEYLREVAQSRKYRQRAQKAEAELEDLRSRALTPEDYQEYQKLRLSAEAVAARDRRIRKLEGTVRQVVGLNELSKALVACGVGSGACHGDKMLVQAAALLAGRIHVELEDDVPSVRVLDDRGQMLLADDGEPIGIQEFVADWLAAEGGHFLPASGDTGSGAHKGESAAAGVSIEALDHNPKAKAEFIARHGPQAYVQLARKTRS